MSYGDKDPFSGHIEGNYIFGRGAADDKGGDVELIHQTSLQE